MPMILFQCPNQIGLGHMSRLAAIAVSVRAIDPQVRLAFVVEGGSHALLESYGLPYLSLPGPRDLRQYWTAWPEAELSRIALDVCLGIVRNLRPEVVVFDCFPSYPFVSAAIECGIPMVLCLRKMKEFDGYFQQMERILPSLSLIIVPHDAGEFPVPEAIKDKCVFVGQVVRPNPGGEAGVDTDGARVIVITAGGGGYPQTVDFYNTAIRALSHVRGRQPTVSALLVTGPLFAEWNRLELAEGVKVLPFAPQMNTLLANAALVVSEAGYNTVAELEALGTEAILIPAERPFDDQHERATTASCKHAHLHVFLGGTELELADLIERCLRKPAVRQISSPPNGASTAGKLLYDLLTQIRSASCVTAAR